MKIKNDNYYQDEAGQWWFKWGKKEIRRTKCSLQTCEGCGEEYLSPGSHYNKRTRFCGKKCAMRNIGREYGGEKAPQWSGGKRINTQGYVEIWIPKEERIKRGRVRQYMLEHRLVIENSLGRYLKKEEQIHHKNGNRQDNRLENLELWIKGHSLPGSRQDDVIECKCCKGKGYILKENNE